MEWIEIHLAHLTTFYTVGDQTFNKERRVNNAVRRHSHGTRKRGMFVFELSDHRTSWARKAETRSVKFQ